MDIKTLLDDVEGYSEQRAITSQQREMARALADEIKTIKSALKHKKIEKQELARNFSALKANGSDLTPAKMQMQEISQELDTLDMRRKECETQLLSLFTGPEDTSPTLPARFNAYSKQCDTACSIFEVQDDARNAWDAYVRAHPQASLYHRYIWRSIIAHSFKHSSYYLVARDALGAIRGVLPLIRLQSRLFGDFAVSVPFFNYGGVLADTAEIARQLLEHAGHLARQLGLSHLEIRSTAKTNDWPSRIDKVSMIRALPESTTLLDEEIGAKVRAQIKRARQEPIDISIGQIELLNDFYRVFAINMRDLGTPVYSRSFFRNILQALPTESHIVVVRLSGKPVAAAFLLGDRDMMEIPWASTLRTANALSMNMLLYRAVLGFCIERGYRFFDFGRSTQDSGTFKFKKQWGAIPVQHYWHYWLSTGGELPALKPDSPKFRLLIACWKKLPVGVANLVGPQIVKSLP